MEAKDILLRLRKEKKLSQVELAEELGITRQTVSRWETGLAMPSSENLIGLSRVYGVPAEELLEGKMVLENAPSEEESAAGTERVGWTGKGKRRLGVAAGVVAVCVLCRMCRTFTIPGLYILLSACNIAIIVLVVYNLIKIIKRE